VSASNTVGRVSLFATATGIGSWPGSAPREAAAVVVGELPGLAHLVELPARGVGADLIGRGSALLVDIGFDTCPRGYRLAGGRSAAARRAASLLAEDLDALEEAWERAGLRGGGRPVKVQAAGPVTLAAELELRTGHRAITDPGAVRDLGQSLAEGLAAHRAELARRLDTTVVVQLDEPLLPTALAGRLTGVTAVTPVPALDEPVAVELLDTCVAAVGTEVAVHCCHPDVPWQVLRRSTIHAVATDPSGFDAARLDGLGEFLDAGRTALLGLVPTTEPDRLPTDTELARAAAELVDRLGFARTLLRERIGISPACGLAGASPGWARTAIELARRTVAVLAEGAEEL